MTAGAPFSDLSRLSEFVEHEIGLHFPPERHADLRRGITSAAREFGFEDVTQCIKWLISTPLGKGQIEILASHLTVGETYFFREKKVFEALEKEILPAFARARQSGERRLRIWSAACCSGEEPYTVAISVRKMRPVLRDCHVTILGTDINPRFLQKAAQGVFSDWSFRDTPAGFKETYFKKTADGNWEILPEIRKMVSFFPLNLAEDAYPSLLNNTNAIDVIFCRNVLIYFSAGQAQRVIQNLTRCLNGGGWLILGPNETTHVSLTGLVPMRLPGVIIYRKLASKSTRPAEPIPSQLEEEPSLRFLTDRALRDEAVALDGSERVEAEFVESQKNESGKQLSLYDTALRLYEQGRYLETVEAIAEEVGRQSNNPQILTLLTRSLANQGKLSEALASSDLVIKADKLNPIGHYLRGSVLHEQGDFTESESSFKRAIYLDPEFVLAHFALGNLARSQGKVSASDRQFMNALTILKTRSADEMLPEGDGLTAGRLSEIITSLRTAKTMEVAS